MGITFNPLIQSGFDFTGSGGGGGGGVTSLNGLNGAITLAPGSNITITPSGNTLTIASTGGSGSVTDVTASAPLSSSGGSTPNISITLANTSTDGYLSSTDWNTFNNKQSFIVNKFTLSPTDISNKYVTLTNIPIVPADTSLDVIGGIQQDYGPDFIVSGNTLSWNGLFLDGVLSSGDKLVIYYF